MSTMDDRQYQKKLEEMRHRHELDKQVLMAQYHQHASSLQHQHQLRLQKHLELVLSQQKQHLDAINQKEELAIVKNKEKDKESAVASTAVKRHLQNFVIGRRKGKVDYNNHSSKPGLRWHHPLIDDVDQHSFESSGIRPPYNDKCDFPLRKTASEPNLKVRSRLKQKLSMEQRASPLLPRQDSKDVKLSIANRIKMKMNAENPTKSTSMTGLNLSASAAARNDHSPSSSARMETGFFEKKSGALGNPSAGDLYTSPSLPNINIGVTKRPADHPMLMSTNEELNRLVSRTASLPGPLLKLNPKQNYPLSLPVDMKDMMLKNAFVMDEATLMAVKALPDYEKEPASLPPSHGPIRPSPISRSHRALIRTQSAPTSVASQLQQHILQKKQHKSLKQYQEQKLMKLGAAGAAHERHVTYPVYYESDADRKELFNRLHGNVSLNYLSATERENLLKYEEKQRAFERQNNEASAMSVDRPLIEEEQERAASVDEIERRVPPQPRPVLSPPPKTEASKPLHHRPLQRTQSSPAASLIKKLPAVSKSYRHTTGVAYNPIMLRHGCSCGDDHTENAGRLKAIWSRLTSCGLIDESDPSKSLCELIECRKATTDELELVHTQNHVLKYGTTSLTRKELDLSNKLIVLPCGGVGVDNKIDVDTVWNEQHTVNAARMAVGCTVDISLLVAQNKLKNGFALVRPPGHHAEKNLAMAFCYFNSVAVATRKLQVSGLAKKILILDWDIHHCNGTQNIFYDDPSVLVISIHRYDDGNFFPGTGSIAEIGAHNGVGFNVNIAFSSDSALGDADYLAAFRTLVLPIARQFAPDMVLVSSGFSAASGHSEMLGGYTVSPQCYGYLTQMLMKLTNEKLTLVLEGGFELEALCDCTEACIRTLRGESGFSDLTNRALTTKPNHNAVQTIQKIIAVQEKHWKNLDSSAAGISHAEWISLSRENETCNALASLTVNHKNFVKPPLIGDMRKTVLNQRISEPPSPVAMEEEAHVKTEHFNDSISNESSPLDVVNTSNPSSPLNGLREDRLLKADSPS